jgi:hypothetical protein
VAKYKIVGKVVNSNKEPISGALVNGINADSGGNFTLEGEYSRGEIFSINISSPGYGDVTKIPFDLNGNTKDSLGVITLKSNKLELDNAIAAELPLAQLQIRALQLEKTDFEMAKQQAMNKIISQIKTVLLPQILTLIAAFGVSKAKDALGKKFGDMNATCPSNLDELNALIRKKNRLTRALNNIYKFLKTIRIGVTIINVTITVAQILLPALTAAASVPGAPGSTAVPIEEIKRRLKLYGLISSSTLLVLTILIEVLRKILQYLATLDSLIQGCAIEGALPQEQLTEDLLKATQEQSQQLSPVVTNVNGFEMEVIPIDSSEINGLKQRRAIAKNKAGVIMLQGEPSFSSNDQILIDELVFYIEQNDLKAD